MRWFNPLCRLAAAYCVRPSTWPVGQLSGRHYGVPDSRPELGRCDAGRCWQLLGLLWRDERAAVISSELVLLCTVGIVALSAAAKMVEEALVEELTDIASAIDSLDQSYCYVGYWHHNACCAGSCFLDADDHCPPGPTVNVECLRRHAERQLRPNYKPVPEQTGASRTRQVKLKVTIHPSAVRQLERD